MGKHYLNIAKNLCGKKSMKIIHTIDNKNGENIHNIEIHPFKPGSEPITELIQQLNKE